MREVGQGQVLQVGGARVGEVIVMRPKVGFRFWPEDAPRPLVLFLPIAILLAGAAGLIMFRVMIRRLPTFSDGSRPALISS